MYSIMCYITFVNDINKFPLNETKNVSSKRYRIRMQISIVMHELGKKPQPGKYLGCYFGK